MDLSEALLRDIIWIDELAEPIFGKDQCYNSYPCVFATVSIELLSTNGLNNVANMIRAARGYNVDNRTFVGYYNFYIGLNDYNPTKVDACMTFTVVNSGEDDDEEQYVISLSEYEQKVIWNILDTQCKSAWQVGCDDLLAEARSYIEEDTNDNI